MVKIIFRFNDRIQFGDLQRSFGLKLRDITTNKTTTNNQRGENRMYPEFLLFKTSFANSFYFSSSLFFKEVR